jgi:hypothetical protein
MEYTIYYENNKEVIDKISELNLVENDVVVCIKKGSQYTHRRVSIIQENNIGIEINLPFKFSLDIIPQNSNKKDFRYNYHEKFRYFGISKKEMFKKIQVRRKK